MRKSICSSFILCLAFIVIGCSTTNQPQHTAQKSTPAEKIVAYASVPKHKPKDPTIVAFYPHESGVKRPYRIIGKETVSRYNFVGIKRQTATVHDIMRNLAASIGGDAVVNITSDGQKMEGTVITYEKVVL